MAWPVGHWSARSGRNNTRGSHRSQASRREVLGRKGGAYRVMHSVRDRAVPGRYRRRPTERGQGLVEYALILILIAIVAILSLIILGGTLSSMISNVGNSV